MGQKAPPVNDEKRRCSVPGCDTVLSRYNPSDELCRVHTKPILNKRWRVR